MEQSQYNQLFSFIWNIANDVLVQAFTKGDYKKIILPMMVLRRLDILLEPTHEAVVKQKEMLSKIGIPEEAQEQSLFGITGYPFCNTSKFTMRTLRGETSPIRLRQNFLEYLDGFSKDVQDIIEKFKLKQQVDNLSDADRLGTIIEKFTDDSLNLGINPVLDADGKEKLPGVDNHTMGTLFEQLLRKFNEENSVTEAGEHFTPRDYVALMADIAVIPVADKLQSATYTIYDGACGTGGILSIAEERIQTLAEERGRQIKINLFGQELQPETYATCKADLMLSSSASTFRYRHAGAERERFFCGSTISNDGHPGMKFDFCISNPPFGTPWKEDLRAWGLKDTEKSKISDRRFFLQTGYNEKSQVRFIPDVGDPQMLFLANNLSRMKDDTELGTRIVEVHNGSSLFTGNAGGGESNLRKHIIENDLLEAIIAMPEKDFYNTGIGTYIWVVTNRKEPRRRGKVQLIDAREIKTPLRKNLGEKNCETNEADRREILRLLQNFEETPLSKIFPNDEFGYWSVTVERPLRLTYEKLDTIVLPELKSKDDVELLERVVKAWRERLGGHKVDDFALFTMLNQAKVKVPATKIKLVRQHLGRRDEEAEPCHVKPTKFDSPVETDRDLRDQEQVPLRYPGGIDGFMEREVLPYAPDAFYNMEDVVIGYELSFTKYFYQPVRLRPIADITADIRGIEDNLKGVLNEIIDL